MRVRIRRPKYATVASTIALFLALGGTAYAAATITGLQIKNGTIGSADLANNSVTGVDVRNLSLGVADLSYSARVALKGAKGATGPAGANGTNGATGPAGPFPTTLPGGKSLTGTWALAGTAAGGGTIAETAISFAFPLATAPTLVSTGPAGAAPNCPGTAAAPAAAPGFLCVYNRYATNASAISEINATTGGAGTSTFGAILIISSTIAGNFERGGTWAVTAS